MKTTKLHLLHLMQEVWQARLLLLSYGDLRYRRLPVATFAVEQRASLARAHLTDKGPHSRHHRQLAERGIPVQQAMVPGQTAPDHLLPWRMCSKMTYHPTLSSDSAVKAIQAQLCRRQTRQLKLASWTTLK